MPGLDGWVLAERLRGQGHEQARIVMLSANAVEVHRNAIAPRVHDGFLMKPVDLERLLDAIQDVLGLHWTMDDAHAEADAPRDLSMILLRRHLHDLTELGELGFLRGIEFKLDEIVSENPESGAVVERLRALIDQCDLPRYMAALGAMEADA